MIALGEVLRVRIDRAALRANRWGQAGADLPNPRNEVKPRLDVPVQGPHHCVAVSYTEA